MILLGVLVILAVLFAYLLMDDGGSSTPEDLNRR